jgi:hypothetical protein
LGFSAAGDSAAISLYVAPFCSAMACSTIFCAQAQERSVSQLLHLHSMAHCPNSRSPLTSRSSGPALLISYSPDGRPSHTCKKKSADVFRSHIDTCGR